jgi:precorrin-6B C5,15-methyltransferase / cobalt-precorrin-6B C5,C15-methyltransferase
LSAPWLHIIGIGEDGLAGLGKSARAALHEADVLVGGDRHLAMIPLDDRCRLAWPSPLSALIQTIVDLKPQRVAVLATGDPMWFGVGVTLTQHVPLAELAIYPAPSAFSLAAARCGWPLAECVQLTLHGRPLAMLQSAIQPNAKLLVLAHDGETTARVAAVLRERSYGQSRLIVLERMGGPSERRHEATADGWQCRAADPFHTLAVECIADSDAPLLPQAPGLPDEVFQHDGQLTKREVRAATLSALAPTPGALLWDIGAGCGSVAIEWMRAAARAEAVAIERNPSRIGLIERNAVTLGTPTLKVIAGEAPAALAELPPPDAVFVGGGLSDRVIAPSWNALKQGGRLVANAVTVEGEAEIFQAQRTYGGSLTRVAISRAEPVGGFWGWRPMMPVTQWSVRK